MERLNLGKRINYVRKERKLTAEKLAEFCNINDTYLRQIEGNMKIPSLPVFISICNSLNISPDYLLQDELESNEISSLKELESLWKNVSPSKQNTVMAIIRTVLELEEETE